MTNKSFNTFVLGQPPATSVDAADSVPLIQGGGTKKALVSAFTSYNVVGPTGGDDTAMLNSAFGGSASRPVFLSFGTYDVRGPLIVPDNGIVVGEEVNAWDFYNGATPRTLLRANATNSFVSGKDIYSNQAILTIGNYSHIRGFSIFGLKNIGGHANVDGIAVPNKAFATIEGIWVNLCYNGINASSIGTVAGGSPWGNNIIGLRIYGGGVLYNETYGFLTAGGSGGYFSDAHLSNLQVVSNQAGGMYCGTGTDATQILNCRIEDQVNGVQFLKAQNIVFDGCIFDRNSAPIWIDSCWTITVSGCNLNSPGNAGSGGGETGTHVRFSSTYFTNQGMAFSGNNYIQGAAGTSYTYGVDAGATVTGYFAETGTPEFNTDIYQDPYSQSIIRPLRVKLGP
jgi:hypothetical protein